VLCITPNGDPYIVIMHPDHNGILSQVTVVGINGQYAIPASQFSQDARVGDFWAYVHTSAQQLNEVRGGSAYKPDLSSFFKGLLRVMDLPDRYTSALGEDHFVRRKHLIEPSIAPSMHPDPAVLDIMVRDAVTRAIHALEQRETALARRIKAKKQAKTAVLGTTQTSLKG
jgi:hypothetical protein